MISGASQAGQDQDDLVQHSGVGRQSFKTQATTGGLGHAAAVVHSL